MEQALLKLTRFTFLFLRMILMNIDNFTAGSKQNIVFSKFWLPISTELPTIIFVLHSNSGLFNSNHLNLLSTLRKSQFQIVTVVNTDEPELFQDQAMLATFSNTNGVLIRKNIGYDLGAYRDAYSYLSKNGYILNQFVLMNSSLIWDSEVLVESLREMASESNDVICASISNQHSQHIQSFLLGSNTQKGRIAIAGWLLGIKNWKFKPTIIRFGEMSTRKILDNDKLNTFAISTPAKLIERGIEVVREMADLGIRENRTDRIKQVLLLQNHGISVNPTHALWHEQLDIGFPGIKLDLIRENRLEIPDYFDLLKYIADNELLESWELAELLVSAKTRSWEISLRHRLKI